MPTSTRTQKPLMGDVFGIDLFARAGGECGASRSFFVFSSYYTGERTGCQLLFLKKSKFFAHDRKIGSGGGAIVNKISAAPQSPAKITNTPHSHESAPVFESFAERKKPSARDST